MLLQSDQFRVLFSSSVTVEPVSDTHTHTFPHQDKWREGRHYRPQRKIRAASSGQVSCVEIQRSPELDFTPAVMETLKVSEMEGGNPFTMMTTAPLVSAESILSELYTRLYPFVFLLMADKIRNYSDYPPRKVTEAPAAGKTKPDAEH